MKLTKKRWIGLAVGIAIFVAAFGLAFASQHHPTWQVWQVKDGTATLNPLNTLSSGDMLISWTGDQSSVVMELDFNTWHTTAANDPIRWWSGSEPVWVYFHNNTQDVNLRPIDPCQDAVRNSDGQHVGRLEAQMWNAAGDHMGSTCWDQWGENQVIPPGGMWKMAVWLRGNDRLMDGDTFDVVFSAVGAPVPAP